MLNLQQRSALSSSPLSEELQCLLGPVTYTSEKQGELAFVAESPYWEGRALIPEDAWYTDGSSHGQPPKWRAVAFLPETIGVKDGEDKSSQWAEMGSVVCEQPGALPNNCLH